MEIKREECATLRMVSSSFSASASVDGGTGVVVEEEEEEVRSNVWYRSWFPSLLDARTVAGGGLSFGCLVVAIMIDTIY